MKRAILLFIAILSSVGLSYAQQRSVYGVVTAGDTGDPLPMVAVLVDGTTTGVSTDNEGRYTITVPGPDAVLVFAYTGYATQRIMVGDHYELNVVMQLGHEEIEEVMVVAYGTVKKESFTGSADLISSKKLEKRPVSNITKSLDGLTTGVMTTSGSGQPGSGSTIRIRGFGSLNASNDPLIVVDGMPYTGTMSSLNPADIESITVLKDASAGALYGARGANGVVMVTTKSGKMGSESMRVNFKGSWGVSDRAIKPYKALNEREYLEHLWHAYRNHAIYADGLDPVTARTAAIDGIANGFLGGTQKRVKIDGKTYRYNPDIHDPALAYDDMEYNPFDVPWSSLIDPVTGRVDPNAQLLWDEDWMDEALRDAPFRHEYSLSISGGGKRSSYVVSFGALWDKGLLVNTDFFRYTGMVGADVKPKDWLAAGLNVNLASTKQNFSANSGLSTNNVWYSAQIMGPLYPVYEHDDSFRPRIDPKTGNKLFDYSENRPNASRYNAIGNLFDNRVFTNIDRVSARSYLTFLDLPDGPLKGLKFTVNLGGDYSLSSTKEFRNRNHGDAQNLKGLLIQSRNRNLSYTANQLLSYNLTFLEDHTIDALVGHESYRHVVSTFQGNKATFPMDGLYDLAAASASPDVTGAQSEYAVESWLGRLNYNYDDRYYLSFSLRRDGSSRFSKDSRWGTFWSVGANWRISQESFLQDVTWINNLSLKASYGVQGNDDLGSNYPYQAVYDVSWSNAQVPGYLLDGLEARDLRWETNGNFNVGLEGRMWNRFSFSMEYYVRRTTGMLMNVPMPFSSGFKTVPRNVGSMLNHGFEFNVSADLIQLENGFRWGLSVLGTTVRNKITKLYEDKDYIKSGARIHNVGYPLSSYYLSESAGVNPTDGEMLYWERILYTEKPGDRSLPTDSLPRRLTKDPAKAGNSRVIAGTAIPDFYGSITTDFEYYGFDLAVMFTYSVGGKSLYGNYLGNLDNTSGYKGQTVYEGAKRAWKYPGDRTDLPRAYVTQVHRPATVDQLVDNSYFYIKNISFGYTFPHQWMEAIDCESLRLSFVADNVVLFSHLPGSNPLAYSLGGDSYSYVPTRSFTFHLDLSF